jgi:uncharacterized membrane protein
MTDQHSAIIGILVVASIVYLTRVGGYLVGQRLRHITGLQSVLETLPGCAMMAILVPVVRQGNVVDFASLVVVLALMWTTDNVVIATVAGMLILVLGNQYI